MEDAINEIISLFDTLKNRCSDINLEWRIRDLMRNHNITFAELNFTEEEFETAKRRALYRHVGETAKKVLLERMASGENPD